VSSERIGVGLIGCGWISEIAHLPNLLDSPRGRIIALADLSDAGRAKAMRRAPGARAYPDAAGLLANPAVEAVIIATPPSVGSSLAVAAFTAGKHVYLEKPGAISLDAAKTIRAAWLSSGKVGMIGYNFRRHVAIESALARVRAGQIGDLVSIQSVFSWAAGEDGGWRTERGSGGVLIDLASHHIDLAALFARSGVRESYVVVRSVQRPDDTADLTLHFACGTVAGIHVSWCEGRNANFLRLYGREGHLEIDLTAQGRTRVLKGDPPRSRAARFGVALRGLDLTGLVSSGAERSFARLLDDFLAACQEGQQASPSIDDAVAVHATLDRARARMAPLRFGADREDPTL